MHLNIASLIKHKVKLKIRIDKQDAKLNGYISVLLQ